MVIWHPYIEVKASRKEKALLTNLANLVLELSIVILYSTIIWGIVTNMEGDDEDEKDPEKQPL